MSLGVERGLETVLLGNTAELTVVANKADESQIEAGEISSINFVIQKPDGTQSSGAGTIQADGSGFFRYTGTNQVGQYIVVATFNLVSGEIRSVSTDFQVSDPFEIDTSNEAVIADQVWLRLEDCFDSAEGGPWLRDMTLRYFNKDKIPHFIQDGLLEINTSPPMTNALVTDFTTVTPTAPTDPDQPVLVQATLLATIRHLMRSYVEQPDPRGANVVWEDRRDYLQRWQSIYQLEEQKFYRWLLLWKRQFLNLGKGALLISTKAGRLYGPGLRTRNVQRGIW